MAELRRAFSVLTASGQTASPLFVHTKLHEAAMGQAVADYTVAERAAREAVSAATAIIGPRSAEAATGLQLLSQAYTFAEQRKLAVDTARQAYKSCSNCTIAIPVTRRSWIRRCTTDGRCSSWETSTRRMNRSATRPPPRRLCSAATAGWWGNCSRPAFPWRSNAAI